MAIKDGGAAFPMQPKVAPGHVAEDRIFNGHVGMSLRDYFAGQAIAGSADGQGVPPSWVEDYARSAYQIADAMLKAREVCHEQ